MTAMGFKNFEETAKMGKPTSFNSSKKELGNFSNT